jgi:F-type H+-transporting ATPase subunit a
MIHLPLLMATTDPAEHFQLKVIIPLRIAGIEFHVTQAVLMMWIGCAILILLFVLSARRTGLIPRGVRNILEALLLFIREDIVKRNLGMEGVRYFPLVATLFFFILFCNWLGLVPFSFTATSNINVTAALALVVFFFVQIEGIRRNGILGYLRHYAPEGVPPALYPLMIPIEIISTLAKPFSLAVRLFANMLAGHMVILLFLGMTATGLWFLKAVPLLGAVIMSLFEIFVGLIQAYIFAMLTAIYLSEVVGEG